MNIHFFRKRTGKIVSVLTAAMIFALPMLKTEASGVKSINAYGSALDDTEKQAIRDKFDKNSKKAEKEISITPELYKKYLAEDVNSSQLYSSVHMTLLEKGQGLHVAILTPEMITLITERQYENAAITAGLSDAAVMVASGEPVTGESALAGIYIAAGEMGYELKEERMKAGSEELDASKNIEEREAGNPDFDSDKLQKVIAEIKAEISIIISNEGQEAVTEERVRQIIDEKLSEYGIKISEESKKQIESFILRLKSILSSDEAKNLAKQLKEWGENAESGIGDLFKQVEDSGLWGKIVNFFSDLWNSILKIFQ